MNAESVRRYEALGCRFIRHPREKDETDTSWRSARLSVWRLRRSLDLGRIDHTLANLSLLVQGAEQGVEVKLIDELVRGVPRHPADGS